MAAPSRKRYEVSHPVISIRVNKQIFDRLQALKRGGQSYADTLRIGLRIQETNLQPLLKRIEELELEELKAEELLEKRTIRYPCYICNGILIVESEQEKEVCQQALRGRFRHSTCK